ncbi:ABC transporter ATP-binding protein [Hydrogenivirga sp. 128-5-R1-1]|uniref:ABC transporter ATP-binding protein n=1 Tax=Hydrogenivirga sp. 128-5-R1-1 TaxID=392423 RepID=UPI00015F188B|nr:ABC transporter ATP-binding protein [Hydrogenivirga sp. 128-5-R1-1]EDP75530.1 ABC transporter [Hydrogenivirga sp. 128-5-R1-1]
MEVIRVENAWKVYPDGTRALKGVSLEVNRGDFIGVMGPSGSGKSTLLHLMGGLDKPSEGEVYLFKKPLSPMREDELAEFRKRRVAYIFQFYYLLEDFSVLENLTLIAQMLGIESPEDKALKILEFLRLSHRLEHKPYQLSGGEQQRVAIGRALISEPAVILADEPTGNIDWEEGRRIFELFRKLNEEEGITFVVATHNPDLKPFFHRIVNLKDGEML